MLMPEEYEDLTPEQLQRFRDIASSPGYLATPTTFSTKLQ